MAGLGQNEDRRWERAALTLAVASVMIWLAMLSWLKPEEMADEHYHHTAARLIAEGRWREATFLPLLPAYHATAAVAVRLFGESLLVMRSYNALLTIAAVLVLRAALRRRGADPLVLLLIIWNPYLFPYGAMSYTEPLSTLLVVTALYMFVRNRHFVAALFVVAAYVARSPNAIWLLMFFSLLVTREFEKRGSASATTIGALRRGAGCAWPYAAGLVAVIAIFYLTRSIVLGSQASNVIRLNRAQVLFFALTGALLWLPLWIRHSRLSWPGLAQRGLPRAPLVALGVGLAALVVALYRNEHPWNIDPAYLRNLLLVALERHSELLALVAVALVLLIPAVGDFLLRQRPPSEFAIVLTFAALLVGAHWMVEPRYYMLPITFLAFFARFEGSALPWLVVWNGLLTLVTCIYFVQNGNTEGGII